MLKKTLVGFVLMTAFCSASDIALPRVLNATEQELASVDNSWAMPSKGQLVWNTISYQSRYGQVDSAGKTLSGWLLTKEGDSSPSFATVGLQVFPVSGNAISGPSVAKFVASRGLLRIHLQLGYSNSGYSYDQDPFDDSLGVWPLRPNTGVEVAYTLDTLGVIRYYGNQPTDTLDFYRRLDALHARMYLRGIAYLPVWDFKADCYRLQIDTALAWDQGGDQFYWKRNGEFGKSNASISSNVFTKTDSITIDRNFFALVTGTFKDLDGSLLSVKWSHRALGWILTDGQGVARKLIFDGGLFSFDASKENLRGPRLADLNLLITALPRKGALVYEQKSYSLSWNKELGRHDLRLEGASSSSMFLDQEGWLYGRDSVVPTKFRKVFRIDPKARLKISNRFPGLALEGYSGISVWRLWQGRYSDGYEKTLRWDSLHHQYLLERQILDMTLYRFVNVQTEVMDPATGMMYKYSSTASDLRGTPYRDVDFTTPLLYHELFDESGLEVSVRPNSGRSSNSWVRLDRDHLRLDGKIGPVEKSELRIRSVTGTLLRRQQIHEQASTVDLNGLPAGILLLEQDGAVVPLVR